MIRWRPDPDPAYGWEAIDDDGRCVARVWPITASTRWQWHAWHDPYADATGKGTSETLRGALIDADIHISYRRYTRS